MYQKSAKKLETRTLEELPTLTRTKADKKLSILNLDLNEVENQRIRFGRTEAPPPSHSHRRLSASHNVEWHAVSNAPERPLQTEIHHSGQLLESSAPRLYHLLLNTHQTDLLKTLDNLVDTYCTFQHLVTFIKNLTNNHQNHYYVSPPFNYWQHHTEVALARFQHWHATVASDLHSITVESVGIWEQSFVHLSEVS